MVDSITKTLGAGSGIDIGALVTNLVEAQYAAKTQSITTRSDKLTAQVSAVSSLKNGITGFASSLASLVKGGTLTTSATSSNTGIVKATALSGAKLAGLSASVEVRTLATAQVAATTAANALASNAATGTGTIRIQFGTDDGGVFSPDATTLPAIAIDSADATLTGVAAKINAAKQGVTASVITENGKERLVLKGATGAAKAFTLTATDTAGDEGLAAIVNVGAGAAGTAIATQAGDAVLAVDGVEVRRAGNTVSDLIPGVKLELQSAVPGTRVTLGATAPTDSLKQAVSDVVATYNELFAVLKEATDPVNGKLAGDSGARDMQRMLRQLTLTDLTGATDGSPRTLAELGVQTNKDGTLAVDSAKLAKVVARNPEAVEAMFADGGAGASGKGLSAALNAISTRVTSRTTGLGASETRYAKAQTALSDEKTKVADAATATKARMTQQYASMDARVAAYKSTQAFMQAQVDAWNAKS